MQYTRLTQDQQKSMLEQRAANLEAEHWNNTVTLATLKAAAGATPSPTDQAEINRLQQNLGVIDKAHAAVEAELSQFDTVTSTPVEVQTNAQPDSAV